jgi:hypothetical protein
MMRLLICILLFFVSCRPQLPDKDRLSKDLYDLQVRTLFQDIDSKCKFEAYKNAELHVDKLVDKWINSSIHDTINFPSRPFKPPAPTPILGTVKRFELDSLQ